MALYKDSTKIAASTSEEFDKTHKPGSTTPHFGIYRCTNCGDEVAANKGNPLPPQNHAQHTTGKPIQWQLTVFAQQK